MKNQNSKNSSNLFLDNREALEKDNNAMLDANAYNSPNKTKISPYFNAYMAAYGIKLVEPDAFKPYQEDINEIESEAFSSQEQSILSIPETARKSKLFKKKPQRRFFIFIVLLLTLAVLTLNVLSVVGVVDLFEYTAGEESVTFGHDDVINSVIIALRTKFTNLKIPQIAGVTQFYYNLYLSNFEKQNTLLQVVVLCLPIFMAIVMIISFIAFIKCLIALFGNKRRKLLGTQLLMFLGMFAFIVLGFFLRQKISLDEIIEYIDGFNGLSITLFSMILVALTFISLILSRFCYRKVDKKISKKNKKNIETA